MYVYVIIIILSILFAALIYKEADNFRERIIDLRKKLAIAEAKYFYVIQISRDKKKLTRDRIKDIREYDKNK